MERRRKEKAEQVAYKLEREIAIWDPTQLQDATEDPFKTLFVARIVRIHLFSTLQIVRSTKLTNANCIYISIVAELRYIGIEIAP